MSVEHLRQQRIWIREHEYPELFPHLDDPSPSGGVVQFVEWLKKDVSRSSEVRGIEFGCGKGRNVNFIAEYGYEMVGMDFVPSAIATAVKRAIGSGLKQVPDFLIHDATTSWPFKDNSFDFVIDCFASCDIETGEGRQFAANESVRVLKGSGYLFAYLLTPYDDFHKKMLEISPGREKNSVIYPGTGKFEKVFDREEALALYDKLALVEERRVYKKVPYFGTVYDCIHYWMIFMNPKK